MGGNLSKVLGEYFVLVVLELAVLYLYRQCLIGRLFGNKEMRLLMLGLDAAGKTSELTHDIVVYLPY
jgi:hypothetical protein